jgi:hypothetical protein
MLQESFNAKIKAFRINLEGKKSGFIPLWINKLLPIPQLLFLILFLFRLSNLFYIPTFALDPTKAPMLGRNHSIQNKVLEITRFIKPSRYELYLKKKTPR